MARLNINTSTPNDGLGDALRNAFNDTNTNFIDLYANKVDKVTGKDLSDNNLTDELVVKILSNEENSQANIQSDWAQNDNTQTDFIKNKPPQTDFEIKSNLILSFTTDQVVKGQVSNIFGGVYSSVSAQPLSVGVDIVGTHGRSKLMIVVNAGSDISGTLTITGKKVDKNTGVITPDFSENIVIDSLSVNGSFNDGLGNNVHNFTNCYITAEWYADGYTISTLDLNLSDVDVYGVAFNQFDENPNVVIDSLDLTAKITNTAAEFSGHAYAVEVVGSKVSVISFADMENSSANTDAGFYRFRLGGLNKSINTATDGIFLDMNFMPFVQTYFEAVIFNLWATTTELASLLIDNSLVVDTIIYGQTLTAGEVVYLSTDGKYYKASNTAINTSTTQIRLITENGILDDEKKAIARGKYVTTGLTAGNEYLGINGGVTSTIPTAPGEIVRILSTAVSTNVRYFNPDNTWILGDGSIINGVSLIDGGGETFSDAWSVGGLDVRAYATNALILDQYYTGDPQTITLNPAPTTSGYLRYIAIVMDVNGIITAQDGAEGVAVLPPSVDTDNYYLIRYLLISYGDTIPTDENGNTISIYETPYAETGTEAGGESNTTTNSGTISINTAGSPFTGVGIRAINPPISGAYIYFNYTTKKAFSLWTSINFNLKLDVGDTDYRVYLQFYNGNTVVGKVLVKNGEYGFISSSSNGQNINIPKEFLYINNIDFDSIRLFVYKSSGTIAGYWLDDVKLLDAYIYNPNIPPVTQIQSDWDQTDANALDYIKNKPTTSDYNTRVEMGVSNIIDWVNPNGVFLKTMIGDTTFLDNNLPTGLNTKKINIYLDGKFTPNFPGYWFLLNGVYNPTVLNKVIAEVINGNIGSEIVYYDIISSKTSVMEIISTSTSATWSPQSIVNNGKTLEWTVSGGVTISKVIIDDPTFDFSTNSGNANILIENVTQLTTFVLQSSLLTSVLIHDAVELEILKLNSNSLPSLDVSTNVNLTLLYCYINNITSLDFTKNTSLVYLWCHTNPLTSLNVSGLIELSQLFCYSASLTSLDVSTNVNLTDLRCQVNLLTSLDVSANPKLASLSCQDNDITSLDVSANTLLTNIDVKANPMTSLNISANTLLTSLRCYEMSLTSLDISTNINLTLIYCYSTSITTLDVSTNVLLNHLRCQNNSFTSTTIDNIFIDLDNNGVTNGILVVDLGRTTASDTAYNNLISKGWSITEQ